MTVKELIEKLKEFPPTAEVLTTSYWGEVSINRIEHEKRESHEDELEKDLVIIYSDLEDD